MQLYTLLARLARLAILKNTYSSIFAERLQWLLLNITSILLIGSIQSFKAITGYRLNF